MVAFLSILSFGLSCCFPAAFEVFVKLLFALCVSPMQFPIEHNPSFLDSAEESRLFFRLPSPLSFMKYLFCCSLNLLPPPCRDLALFPSSLCPHPPRFIPDCSFVQIFYAVLSSNVPNNLFHLIKLVPPPCSLTIWLIAIDRIICFNIVPPSPLPLANLSPSFS